MKHFVLCVVFPFMYIRNWRYYSTFCPLPPCVRHTLCTNRGRNGCIAARWQSEKGQAYNGVQHKQPFHTILLVRFHPWFYIECARWTKGRKSENMADYTYVRDAGKPHTHRDTQTIRHIPVQTTRATVIACISGFTVGRMPLCRIFTLIYAYQEWVFWCREQKAESWRIRFVTKHIK